MLHSPVPDSIPTPNQTTLSVPAFGGTFTTLQPSIPPTLPPFVPFPTQAQITAFASRLSTVPTSLSLSGNGPSSGSSSLSSSLMSLHSPSPNGSAVPTPASLVLPNSNQPSSSNTRYSRWLKLRVCPSCLSIPPPPPSSSSPSSAAAADDSSLESVKGLQCSFSPDTCPYAHPAGNIRIEAGHVTVCYDFIKRKLCKHSSCKYYHPPPHQIEAVLKRGDEQRKMLDGQQRLTDFRPGSYMSMHPQPSTLVNNGLSTLPSAAVTSCVNNTSAIPWNSSATLALLQQNQTIAGTNPLFGGNFIPCLNPNAISALSIPFASPSSDPTTLRTSAVLAAAAAATMQPPTNLSTTSLVGASMLTQSINQQQASHTDNNVSSTSQQPLSDSRFIATNSTVTTSGGHSGPWLPSKRSNHQWNNYGDEQATTCNGDAQCVPDDAQRILHAVSLPTSGVGSSAVGSSGASSFPQGYVAVSGGTANPSVVQSSMSNLLSPLSLGLYGLPMSTVTQPYLNPHMTYPTVHSTQGTADGTQSTLAALTLNNLLTQQQHPAQVQSQLIPPIPISVQSAAAPLNPSNLAAALAAIQQQQQHAPTQHLSASSPTVQAYLLSNLVRAQQSQQAQLAQMIAAVQATDGTGVGFLPTGTSPHTNALGSLPGNCLIDPSYGLPLNSLGACPYSNSFTGAAQSLITNVAYINDRGHLLETLPICRDFKAGKCHRNGDCRYVHLVDENVEVNQGRVVVCRDAAKGRCTRMPCKYYHIPLFSIPTNRCMALNSALTGTGLGGTHHSL